MVHAASSLYHTNLALLGEKMRLETSQFLAVHLDAKSLMRKVSAKLNYPRRPYWPAQHHANQPPKDHLRNAIFS